MVEEKYLIAKGLGLLGLSQQVRQVIEQIALGDMATFDLGKKNADSPRSDPTQRVQQFRGIASVSSAPFESEEIFCPVREASIFPHRIKVAFLSE